MTTVVEIYLVHEHFYAVDIDECPSDPCDSNANCSNSVGSFTCTCDSGYSGGGFQCTGELVISIKQVPKALISEQQILMSVIWTLTDVISFVLTLLEVSFATAPVDID